jgi:hypothetical protein
MHKSNGVGQALADLVSPSDTAEQKVKKIYAYVAQLENLSYEPQRSEQERKTQGIKDARGVQDVLRDGRGDRDDLTLLFVAMVRAAGIPAWPVWVVDRSELVFQKNYLSPKQFDAHLAIVKLGGKEVFLDPGTRFCPYGLLYWKYTSSTGIRQNSAGTTELVQTPAVTYVQAIVSRVGHFRLNEQGKLEGTLAVGFIGQEALTRRLQAFETDAVGRTKQLEDEVKSWLPLESEISLTNIPDWEKAEVPLLAEFKVTAPTLTSAGKRLLMPWDLLVYERPAMFTHGERQYDIDLDYSNRHVDKIHIVFPDDIQIDTIPPSEGEKRPYAIYHSEHTLQGKELVSVRDLATNAFVFPTSEYKQLKAFFDRVKECDDQKVLLKRESHVASK